MYLIDVGRSTPVPIEALHLELTAHGSRHKLTRASSDGLGALHITTSLGHYDTAPHVTDSSDKKRVDH